MKINNWFIALVVLVVVMTFTQPYIKKHIFIQDDSIIEQDDGHDEPGREEFIRLDKDQIEEIGLELSKVEHGSLANRLSLTGEIKINEDQLAHIVAYSSGVVKQVNKRLGDYAQKGEVLAVLDAPEISGLQEEYLEAVARLEIAKANFEREKQLQEESLTTQSDFLAAKDDYIRAEHDLHSNERKLKVFGFKESEINSLEHHHEAGYSYYKIIAPYSGTVIEKRISTGEALEQNARIFSIADLSTVWIDFNLYQKDLPFIKENQKIEIEIPNFRTNITGRISFVSPLIGENTRTAFARVITPNTELKLKPGTFVTGLVNAGSIEKETLLIKKTAIQEIEGNKVVFVQTSEGFKAQVIKTGGSNEDYIEVLSGIEVGQTYVSANSFMLKAEMQKDEMDDDHGH